MGVVVILEAGLVIIGGKAPILIYIFNFLFHRNSALSRSWGTLEGCPLGGHLRPGLGVPPHACWDPPFCPLTLGHC